MINQPFLGMDRETGQPIAGLAVILQAFRDILTTRRGARRMRPLYGSTLPDMVDLPMTAGLFSAMQAEIARALNDLNNWSTSLSAPLIRVQRVTVSAVNDGQISMRLAVEIDGEATLLELTS